MGIWLVLEILGRDVVGISCHRTNEGALEEKKYLLEKRKGIRDYQVEIKAIKVKE